MNREDTDNYDDGSQYGGSDQSQQGAPPANQPGYDQVASYYQQYLGRAPENSDVVNQWLSGHNGNFSTIQSDIQNTPEAQAYAAQQAAPPPQAPPPPPRTGPGTGNDQYGNPLPAAAPPPPPQAAPPSAPVTPQPQLQTEFDPIQPGNPGSAPGAPPGVSDELYKQLLDRAHEGTVIDPNDPNIKQQVDPFAAQVERQRRNYMADKAESSNPLTNLAGEDRLSSERAGQATGMLQSQLVGSELKNRRDEIQNSLTQLGAQMTSDQQQQLQKELGYLNASMQKYGIDVNGNLDQQKINSGNDQFNKTFDLNSTGQANYWDAIRRGLIHG